MRNSVKVLSVGNIDSGGIHHYLGSRCRKHNDSQPDRVAIVEQTTLKIKKEGFQKRVSHFGKDQFQTLMCNSDCVNNSMQAYQKRRVVSTPSTLPAPEGAPDWTKTTIHVSGHPMEEQVLELMPLGSSVTNTQLKISSTVPLRSESYQ